jgi:hypothetical protein
MAKITKKKPGIFEVSNGEDTLKLDFNPLMAAHDIAHGQKCVIQHWNKLTCCFGLYDVGSNLYFCEYPVSQLAQFGICDFRMIEISKRDNPEVTPTAANVFSGYISVLQLPESLIIQGCYYGFE